MPHMILALAAAALFLIGPAAGQSVPCWFVPAGAAVTMQCANGYWLTTMPDGTVVDGNGMDDPNATARGSGIPLGQPAGRAGLVTAPTQIIPTPAPGQAERYGLPPTE